MRGHGLAVGATIADASSTRLEVGKVRTARHFEPTFLSCRKNFEVVLLGMGEANLARTHAEHAVRQIQLLKGRLHIIAELFQLFH